MLVVKRDGRRESVRFDKITSRIENLCYELDPKFIQPIEVAKKVIDGLYDGQLKGEWWYSNGLAIRYLKANG